MDGTFRKVSLHDYKCRMKDLQSLQLLLGSFVLFGIMFDFEDMLVFFLTKGK